MKRFFLTAVLLLSILTIYSQTPQLNLKAGATHTWLLGRNSGEFDNKFSGFFSVYLNTKMSETYMIKTDVQLAGKSFAVTLPGYYSYSTTDYIRFHYRYIQILPFIPTYLKGRMQFFGAPYIGFLLDGSDNIRSYTVGTKKPDPTDGVRQFQFGMELGIEREAYWGINFGIRFQHSFVPVFTSNSKLFYTGLVFTMGYNFGKKNWREEESGD